MIKCLICNREFNNIISLSRHLRSHKISSKDYYDKYLKKDGEGICPMYGRIPSCKKYTKFRSWRYLKHCSTRCSTLEHDVKVKYKQTNLKRYDVENPLQNKKIREKIKQTNLKRYGVDNPLKNEKIIRKKELTNLKRYGVKNPLENKNIRNKGRLTCKLKYGVESIFEDREKIKKCFIEKYGVDNPFKCKKFKNNLIKYKKIKYFEKIKEILNYMNLELLSDYKKNRDIIIIKCLNCNYIYKTQMFYILQNCNNRCPKCFPINKSKGEKELVEFIKSLNIEFVENSRKIIKPLELDIYIPSKKIAIEFNGLYWHSEEYIKDKNYHLIKTEECLKNNIQLIHIFEDEWIFKQNIVKSRLKQILKISTSQRIHARKCQIKEISPKVKNEFLNNFHIQGEDRSNIKLGAFYQNELISVMTFSKGNISKGSKSKEGVWELNRFCSNSSYHIPGIASRFLAYFKRNYKWKDIFSYADRRWSNGNVYNKIGFKLDSITKPNYWYVKGMEKFHRFGLRKRPNEPKDIPEWILRAKEGYHRIYDCGHYKFVIRNGE